jgi:hypothetical protein
MTPPEAGDCGKAQLTHKATLELLASLITQPIYGQHYEGLPALLSID